MPVITPAFPSMCSTHTVMRSTKKVMMEEFKRADEIVHAIHAGRKNWSDLFERHTFFTKDHKYYLSVIATSPTKEMHDSFSGLVRSKVRHLVKGIEDGDAGVEIARPYMDAFERTHRYRTEEELDRIKQGKMDFVVVENEANGDTAPQANGDVSKEKMTVYTSTFYIGLTLAEGNILPPCFCYIYLSLTLMQAVLSRLISRFQ